MSISDFIAIIVATIVWNLLGNTFGYEMVVVNLLVFILYEIWRREVIWKKD